MWPPALIKGRTGGGRLGILSSLRGRWDWGDWGPLTDPTLFSRACLATPKGSLGVLGQNGVPNPQWEGAQVEKPQLWGTDEGGTRV